MKRLLFLLLPLAALAGKKPPPALPAAKIRVFVGESESFYASSFGALAATSATRSASNISAATVEKMTVLIMKDLYEKCPTVTVVNAPDKADLFLRLDRNGLFVRQNAMAVFNHSGEMIFAGASINLTKEVKRFCAGLPYAP